MTEPAPDDQMTTLLRQTFRGSLAERMGIEIGEISRDRVTGTMPVDNNTQPYGLLHGGASCVLAESLASTGAAFHGWPDRSAVGIEISASHHRSATSGVVTGVATVLHAGRMLSAWQVEISDDQGRRLCSARVTCVLRES